MAAASRRSLRGRGLGEAIVEVGQVAVVTVGDAEPIRLAHAFDEGCRRAGHLGGKRPSQARDAHVQGMHGGVDAEVAPEDVGDEFAMQRVRRR